MKPANAKFLALAVLILLPVVILLVFRSDLKHQEIKIPKKYFVKGTDSVLVNGKKVLDSVYHQIPPFSLKSHLDKDYSDQDLKGYISVVDFFFTNCPGICPKMTSQLERVQKAFASDENVQIVSLTVDPVRDSVETLKNYADQYGAVPGKWHFLTGEKPELYELARKGFFISADEGDGGPHDFIHSEKFVLLDHEKRIRGYYIGIDSADVNRMMADIVLLLEKFD